MATMKVRVTLSIEVDVEAWNLAYGTGSATAIRQDVADYVVAQVQGCAAADEGGIVNVERKAQS